MAPTVNVYDYIGELHLHPNQWSLNCDCRLIQHVPRQVSVNQPHYAVL